MGQVFRPPAGPPVRPEGLRGWPQRWQGLPNGAPLPTDGGRGVRHRVPWGMHRRLRPRLRVAAPTAGPSRQATGFPSGYPKPL